MIESSQQIPETLAALAETLSVPSDWTVTHKTPDSHLSNAVPTERVHITCEDRFDRDAQTHDELPVTGVRITIRADEHRDLYETVYTPMLNTAEFTTKRLVISSLPEAVEWAERMRVAVDDTPDGWVIMPTDSLEMNRWITEDGMHDIQLWQDDRDYPEDREYRVLSFTRNEFEKDTKETAREGLRTSDLYDTVIDVLSETYRTGSSTVQDPPRLG